MNASIQKNWLAVLEKSLVEAVTSPFNDRLPGFPSDHWQMHSVGLSGVDAIREASKFMETSVRYFQMSPLWLLEDKRLLDFGTGWGRIARCFMRDFRGENITGSDINPVFLEMCRWNFTTGRFVQTQQMPPFRSVFDDVASTQSEGSTDFIVAYSVFSHLSEEACTAWLEEFSKLLVPGGMISITTRGRWFFDTAEALQGQGVTGHAKGLSEMFENFDEARRRYDEGQLVHGTNDLIGDGKYYGETFIPEAFVRKAYGHAFEFVAFHEEKDAHPVIVLKKRG